MQAPARCQSFPSQAARSSPRPGDARELATPWNHPCDIHIPSTALAAGMSAEIHRLRDKAGETEKITINLGYVDLGHIDLLVQEGFYSNRTDFIRTAIRNRLAAHAEE